MLVEYALICIFSLTPSGSECRFNDASPSPLYCLFSQSFELHWILRSWWKGNKIIFWVLCCHFYVLLDINLKKTRKNYCLVILTLHKKICWKSFEREKQNWEKNNCRHTPTYLPILDWFILFIFVGKGKLILFKYFKNISFNALHFFPALYYFLLYLALRRHETISGHWHLCQISQVDCQIKALMEKRWKITLIFYTAQRL